MSRPPGLYLITDRRLHERPLAERLGAALDGLAPDRIAVQLREKDLGARALLELGRGVLEVCRAHRVPLLVNERIDVALALGADGVHLGGGALAASEARRLLGPQALIGVSTHGVDELRERSPGADFATWGPVFPTASKARYGPPVGLENLDQAMEFGVPLVALGGITAREAGALRARGFSGLACIGAVFSSPHPGAAARELLTAFDDG